MRTAVILIGNVRTWDVCKQNFLETFGPLSPDIYVITYNKRYNYHPHIQNVIGDWEDYAMTNDEVVDMFRDINPRMVAVDSKYDIVAPDDVADKFKSHPSTCYQFIKMYQALSYACEQERINNFKYDTIIKTRCDIIYNPIDLTNVKDHVIVDSGNVFPNDCVIAASRDNMIRVVNFGIEEIHNPIYQESDQQPPHGLLHCAIKHSELPIETQKIMRHVVRKGNKLQEY